MWQAKINPQSYVKMQLVDIPVRQTISQSGLYDSSNIASAVEEVAAPEAAKAKAPRAPRKPKAEKAPVPPPAPPAPVAVAAAPKKAVKAKPAPAAPGPETSPVQKGKFAKGSEEAKAHMAKLREAAKAKKAAVTAASKTPEGGSEADDFGGAPAKKKVVRKKPAVGDKIAMEA